MKFDGKKHINSNMYNKIRITDRNGEVEVTALPDERFKHAQLQKTSTPYITDRIKNLTEEEKVRELVQYFLSNNTIYKIVQEENAIVIYGTSQRQLRLNLSAKYSDLFKLIIEKYNDDRVKQLNEISVEKIKFILSYGITSYSIVEEKNDNGINECVIYLNLMKKPTGEIVKFDSEFIDNYVNEFINNNVDTIRFMRSYDTCKFGFVGNGIKIFFPTDEFYKKYHSSAYLHNQKLIDEEKNQLVLEFVKDSMPKKHIHNFYRE